MNASVASTRILQMKKKEISPGISVLSLTNFPILMRCHPSHFSTTTNFLVLLFSNSPITLAHPFYSHVRFALIPKKMLQLLFNNCWTAYHVMLNVHLKYGVQHVESCWTKIKLGSIPFNKFPLVRRQQVATMFNVSWSTKVEGFWTVCHSLSPTPNNTISFTHRPVSITINANPVITNFLVPRNSVYSLIL